MDPVTFIVAALVSGAAAGLQPTVAQAVKDSYTGIKTLIVRKYGNVGLAGLERKPDSEAKQAAVAEDLRDGGAEADQELLAAAKQLLDAVKAEQPQAAAAVGVDLNEVEAAFLKIQKVQASGTGIKVKKSKFSGGIEIGEVKAGDGGPDPN